MKNLIILIVLNFLLNSFNLAFSIDGNGGKGSNSNQNNCTKIMHLNGDCNLCLVGTCAQKKDHGCPSGYLCQVEEDDTCSDSKKTCKQKKQAGCPGWVNAICENSTSGSTETEPEPETETEINPGYETNIDDGLKNKGCTITSNDSGKSYAGRKALEQTGGEDTEVEFVDCKESESGGEHEVTDIDTEITEDNDPESAAVIKNKEDKLKELRTKFEDSKE